MFKELMAVLLGTSTEVEKSPMEQCNDAAYTIEKGFERSFKVEMARRQYGDDAASFANLVTQAVFNFTAIEFDRDASKDFREIAALEYSNAAKHQKIQPEVLTRVLVHRASVLQTPLDEFKLHMMMLWQRQIAAVGRFTPDEGYSLLEHLPYVKVLMGMAVTDLEIERFAKIWTAPVVPPVVADEALPDALADAAAVVTPEAAPTEATEQPLAS
jgi:hypothetical protein